MEQKSFVDYYAFNRHFPRVSKGAIVILKCYLRIIQEIYQELF
jgi:hypothetical protein